jgi:hypothetical protein
LKKLANEFEELLFEGLVQDKVAVAAALPAIKSLDTV